MKEIKDKIKLRKEYYIIATVLAIVVISAFYLHMAASVSVTLKSSTYTYTGKTIKPKIKSVKYKNKSVKKSNRKITYQKKNKKGKWKTIKNPTKVGTYRVKVTVSVKTKNKKGKKITKKYTGYKQFTIKKKKKQQATTESKTTPSPTEKPSPTPTPSPTPSPTPANEKKYEVIAPYFECNFRWIGSEANPSDNMDIVGSRIQNYIVCSYCGKEYTDTFKMGSGIITTFNGVDAGIDGATVKLEKTALQNYYDNDPCYKQTYTESELNEPYGSLWKDEKLVKVTRKEFIENTYCVYKQWVKKYNCYCSKELNTCNELEIHMKGCSTHNTHHGYICSLIKEEQLTPTFTEIK